VQAPARLVVMTSIKAKNICKKRFFDIYQEKNYFFENL
jgi:hypothetical protein